MSMNANAAPFSCNTGGLVFPMKNPCSAIHEITRGLPTVANCYIDENVLMGFNNTPSGPCPVYAKVTKYCPKDVDLTQLPQEEQEKLRQSKLYSIDVECVATGYRHCDRDVARIAIVNAMCEVVYQSFVKPKLDIVSYLTPLTGITKEDLANAPSLEDCMKEIRSILPHDCILVGQGINHDIYWLGLKLGEDFANVIDLLYMFCYRNYPSLDNTPKSLKVRGGMTSFSLRQVVLCLIGVDIQSSWHNPLVDAIYSMKLYLLFRNCSKEELDLLRCILMSQPRLLSFSQQMQTIDGVELKKKKHSCINCREQNYQILDIWNPLYD